MITFPHHDLNSGLVATVKRIHEPEFKDELDRAIVASQFRKASQFLRELWADLRFLFAAELSKAAAIPLRENFDDAALHSAAVKELMHRHRHAVLKQALEKQRIRETLWPRFRDGLLLTAPITFPLCMVVPTVWVTGMMANHQVWEWFALNFCAYRIEGWFSHRPHSSRSPPGRGGVIGIRRSPKRDERGSLIIAGLCPLNPNSLSSEFSDEDLETLLIEVARCRTRWRIWHYARLIAILGLIVWTFWLMPYAVRHRSPFG